MDIYLEIGIIIIKEIEKYDSNFFNDCSLGKEGWLKTKNLILNNDIDKTLMLLNLSLLLENFDQALLKYKIKKNFKKVYLKVVSLIIQRIEEFDFDIIKGCCIFCTEDRYKDWEDTKEFLLNDIDKNSLWWDLSIFFKKFYQTLIEIENKKLL